MRTIPSTGLSGTPSAPTPPAPPSATATATAQPTPTAMPGPAPNPIQSAPTSSVQDGPAFVHLQVGYTPQGQGYDAARQQVITSYYKDDRVLLSIQRADTGSEVGKVGLGGSPPPAHGGGVATDGERVFVSDTNAVYVYRRADLQAASKAGVDAQPIQQWRSPAATSPAPPLVCPWPRRAAS